MFLRVAYCVGLNLPIGPIVHLSGETLKRIEALHVKIRQACAWKELQHSKAFVASVGEVEMDPALKSLGWDKYQEFRVWFDKRLDSAIQAAIDEERQAEESSER